LSNLTCTLKMDTFAVYDNVFPMEKQTEIFDFVNDINMISVLEKDTVEKRFLFTGTPLVSHAFFSKVSAVPDAESEDPHRIYPTGDTIDDIFELIIKNQDEFSDIVGVEGTDWERFSASAFAYAQNASATWHRDAENYTGAFIYYLTPSWKPQWGGELFIGNNNSVRSNGAIGATDFTSDEISIGHFIAPITNRLVVLKRGIPHKISPVTPSAGDAVRYSITGFFRTQPPVIEVIDAPLTAQSLVIKRPTKYVVRANGNEVSLLARNYGAAFATKDHLQVFEYISSATRPFSAGDLPGAFSADKKLTIVEELLDIDVLEQVA